MPFSLWQPDGSAAWLTPCPSAGGLRLYNSSGNKFGIKAPPSLTNGDYSWPTAIPSAPAVMQSDASGNLSWSNSVASWTVTGNSSTSAPAFSLTGSLATGTGAYPGAYFNFGGTAPTFNTSGTGVCITVPSGFNGLPFAIYVNGGATPALSFSSGSSLTIGSGLTVNKSATSLSATTSGSISYTQPITGTNIKIFTATVSSYLNSTGTAQTITFSTAFTNTPTVLAQPGSNWSGMTVSATTLTLPSSMGAAASGTILLMGI